MRAGKRRHVTTSSVDVRWRDWPGHVMTGGRWKMELSSAVVSRNSSHQLFCSSRRWSASVRQRNDGTLFTQRTAVNSILAAASDAILLPVSSTAVHVASARYCTASAFITQWLCRSPVVSSYYLRRRRRLCFYFGLFVCLLVCPSDNWKSCERVLTKFLGGIGHGQWTKGINFGDDPDHRPDPRVRRPKSGFTGLSKKYLVDSDQSCIANLHCKNL